MQQFLMMDQAKIRCCIRTAIAVTILVISSCCIGNKEIFANNTNDAKLQAPAPTNHTLEHNDKNQEEKQQDHPVADDISQESGTKEENTASDKEETDSDSNKDEGEVVETIPDSTIEYPKDKKDTETGNQNNGDSDPVYHNDKDTLQMESNIETTETRTPSYAAHISGSFKYNPIVSERFENLDYDSRTTLLPDHIKKLEQKNSFENNHFLNQIQQRSDYFRFQQFQPLVTRDYYKNLDKQVLGLIAGEVGGMPDLQRPSEKAVISGQQEDKKRNIEQTRTLVSKTKVKKEESTETASTSNHWLWYIVGMGTLFAILTYIIWRRK
ncbi:SdrH family protein [Staphylococcus sp. 17KM0847]|uniref:SdrH family protein n=1 Tax=Staphylococcus sp. 17KM0847 TaxID=2583989 RepID=UPI0015DCFA47|nr:SdrH family protein [Staphylococcus sp. 17KM0847]QLK86452.1 hypothetical protein FGL66_06975 [Staphylococcus sp. 17KM0847]